MKKCIQVLSLLLLTTPLLAQMEAEEQAIEKLVQSMANAWTAADGEQFASIFADTCDFIVWNGMYNPNYTREANAKGHQRIFDTIYKGTQVHYQIDKIKFIRPDIALIHVFGAVNKKGEARPKDPFVLWSGLLEKSNGKWKILAFHNLDLEVFQSEEQKKFFPVPPEVMYSGWYQAGNQ